ncbi:MAG TPA: ABC transporter ATP-binding protein [Acidobacteriota bacterium]
MDPVIELIDLKKSYQMGENVVPALQGVQLRLDPGEFVAVMGASGSGKSTLMNIVGCLDRPSSGKYVLEGNDVSRLDRDSRAEIRNDKIGFVFQNFNLLARTSAVENVELPLIYSRKRKLTEAEMRQRAVTTLARVGLKGWENHTPAQLSGGQQQRVAIARSLINEPSILLADEPTGNLDSHTSEQIMAIFQSLNEQGITILLITHESDIASYARRIITLRDGKVIFDQRIDQRKIIHADQTL